MADKDVEQRVDRLESKFDVLVQELHDFKDEMRDFRTEMRQQNEMRAAEIRELQKRQDAMQAKHENDMREMNKKIDDKFDKLSDQLHTMTITAVIGFCAIVVAIGGLIVAALK